MGGGAAILVMNMPLFHLVKQENEYFSPGISEKKMFRYGRYVVVQMSGLGLKVTGQLDIWYSIVSLGQTFPTGIMISAKTVIEK